MSWSHPKTWIFGEMVTAAKLNEQVLNRLNDLWKYAEKGDFMVATDAQNAARIPAGSNTQAFTCDNSQASGTKWAAALPIGSIVIWSGSIVSIPSGWALCNGSGGTPDLRDRFVLGAGSSYSPGATGGALTANDTHTGHTFGGTVDETGYSGLAPGTDPILANKTHSHTWGSGGNTAVDILPPYYALAFIMRTS